ncbi:MAG: Hpt domain-containing protein, partial [Verrucomicrobiota bacterium]
MIESFTEEAASLYEPIEQEILEWEKQNEPESRKAGLRRHFHTLKGAANSVGLTDLGQQFHYLEDYMENITVGDAQDWLFTYLLSCMDEVKAYLDQLQENVDLLWQGNWQAKLESVQSGGLPETTQQSLRPDAIDPEMLEVFIEEASSLYEPIESAVMQWEQGKNEVEQKGLLKRHFHTLKGAANSVGITELGHQFHTLEDYMERLDTTETPDSLFSFLLRCLDELQDFTTEIQNEPRLLFPENWEGNIEKLSQGESLAVTQEKQASLSKEDSNESKTLRVDAHQLKNLMHLINEMITDRKRSESLVLHLQNLDQDLQSTGETRLKPYLEKFKEDNLHFSRQAKQIQNELTELNLGPVSTLFRKLSRAFRDACKEEGKEAEWITRGEQTQLDRSVVDYLYGPLLHVVRNAVAHGIESPERRREDGKPSSGKVIISAYPQSGQVILEIEDDGAGINKEAVISRGIERGLIPAGTTELTNDEVISILFMPGFSTKETVSSVAGRGVGLDVVKGDIESLNGTVNVDFEPGKGTIWRIKVPLSLTASDALIVQVADRSIALPLSYIDYCIQLHADDLNEQEHRTFVAVGDERLPYLALDHFLFPETATKPSHGVIVDTGIDRAVLGVNGLHSRREIIVKDLGPLFGSFPIYAGVTSGAEGDLIPILQLPNLLSRYVREIGSSPASTEKPPQ